MVESLSSIGLTDGFPERCVGGDLDRSMVAIGWDVGGDCFDEVNDGFGC